MKRTFIYTDEKSNKFWTIEVNGNNYTVNYGKVGTAGQTQTKDFVDEAACQKAVDKLIAEKTKKGYMEQDSDDTENDIPAEIPVIEGLEENQIAVDLNSVADMKRVLTMLTANIKHWSKVVEDNEGIEYGQLIDDEFETYDSEEFATSEEAFLDAAAQHKELFPLIEKYIKAVDPNDFFQDDLRMGMNAVFRLAFHNNKYIPLFIEHHRTIRPGGGETQMEHILDLLSDTDNGLRLLAACALYAIDQPDIEYNLEPWIEEYVGDDEEKQEKLFKYIMLEAKKVPANNEYRNDYVMEALDAMGIDYNEDTLAEILDDIDPKNLPSIDDLGEGGGHTDKSIKEEEPDNSSKEDEEAAMYLSHVNHILSQARPKDIETENWNYNSVYGIGGHAFMQGDSSKLLTDKAKQFLTDKDYYYFDALLRFYSQILRSKTLVENGLQHLKHFFAGLTYFLPGVDTDKAAEILYNDSDGEYIPKREEILLILGGREIKPLTGKPFKIVVKGLEIDIPADFGLVEKQQGTNAKVKQEVINGNDYLFFVEGEFLAIENKHFKLKIINKSLSFGKMVNNLGGYTNLTDKLTGSEIKKYAAFASWRTYMRKTMKECWAFFGVTGGVVWLNADVPDKYNDEFFNIALSVKPVSAPVKSKFQELANS